MIKKENEEKTSEEDIEKEWKKLKEKIKNNLRTSEAKKSKKEKDKEIKVKIPGESIEKSELEEQIEKSELIEDNEFQEFSQPSVALEVQDIPIPILERLESSSQSQESLEQNVSLFSAQTQQAQSDTIQTEANPVSYSPGEDYSSERKYEERVNPLVLRPTGMSQELQIQEFMNPSEWMSENVLDVDRGRVDIESIGENRRLPFETREDKKYKEVKL